MIERVLENELLLARAAIENSSQPVQLIDDLGNSLFHNYAFIKLFGYSVAQLNNSGGPFSLLSDINIAQQIVEALENREYWVGKVTLYNLSGEVVPIVMRIYVVKKENASIGSICIYGDVNPEVLGTNYNIHSVRQIQEAEKLARLGFFSSAISHELNNPLNIIQTKLYFLEKSFKSGNDLDVLENIEKIRNQIDRLANLAQSIMQYAKPRSKKGDLVNVNQIILKTLRLLNDHFNENIDFVTELDTQLAMIVADPTGLEIVFKNIILNAIESLPERGRIEIKTCNNNQHVKIRIKDNGRGIPVDIKDKIFDPFFTSKAKEGGFGLGLSLSESIIQEHNGTINVESKEFVGTEFLVSLPVLS